MPDTHEQQQIDKGFLFIADIPICRQERAEFTLASKDLGGDLRQDGN